MQLEEFGTHSACIHLRPAYPSSLTDYTFSYISALDCRAKNDRPSGICKQTHMYTDFEPLEKWIEVARTGVNDINNELWLLIHSGGVNNEFNIALAVHFTQPMVYSRVGERIGVRVCSSR